MAERFSKRERPLRKNHVVRPATSAWVCFQVRLLAAHWAVNGGVIVGSPMRIPTALFCENCHRTLPFIARRIRHGWVFHERFATLVADEPSKNQSDIFVWVGVALIHFTVGRTTEGFYDTALNEANDV